MAIKMAFILGCLALLGQLLFQELDVLGLALQLGLARSLEFLGLFLPFRCLLLLQTVVGLEQLLKSLYCLATSCCGEAEHRKCRLRCLAR